MTEVLNLHFQVRGHSFSLYGRTLSRLWNFVTESAYKTVYKPLATVDLYLTSRWTSILCFVLMF